MDALAQEELVVFHGTQYTAGTASAVLLASDLELSFWGGVNSLTGEIIDRFHPLCGRSLKDTILAIPGGRGSCTGSAVILELILNGQGPKALVFQRIEEIITLGVMISEEFFKKNIPVLVLDSKDFRGLLKWDGKLVHLQNHRLSILPSACKSVEGVVSPVFDISNVTVDLTEYDRMVLQGIHGEASKFSLKVIIRIAHMMGAPALMDVSNAHVDVAYYGPGSVALGQKLRSWGGRFRVPTTTNALKIDCGQWRALGVDLEFGTTCEELTQTFVDMGAMQSFTCAPYLGDNVPKLGDAVAWGESNAVIYTNSVLGARTLKFSNMLEYLIALTGRAPQVGTYLTTNRLASVWIKVQPPIDIDDAFWPILGYTIGRMTNVRIPVISGLEGFKPSTDDFKAFSAAFGTSSSASMFHMVGLTPEAPTVDAAWMGGDSKQLLELKASDLCACWEMFNRGKGSLKVDLISLGSPHFSFNEIKKLALLCRGKTKAKDVSIVVTSGRSQYGLATQAGYVGELERFGVQFLTDTCWCFIEEPIIPKKVRVIMTNSGKFTHYGPGLTGKEFCFGSLKMCVLAACSGGFDRQPPSWMTLE